MAIDELDSSIANYKDAYAARTEKRALKVAADADAANAKEKANTAALEAQKAADAVESARIAVIAALEALDK